VAIGDGDAAFELAMLLNVSDAEIENVKKLLLNAVNSVFITEDSREKAQLFLKQLEDTNIQRYWVDYRMLLRRPRLNRIQFLPQHTSFHADIVFHLQAQEETVGQFEITGQA
jgi:hypothetical protein